MRYMILTLSMLLLAACNQINGLRTDISATLPETGDEEVVLKAALRDAYACTENVCIYAPTVVGLRNENTKVYHLTICDPKAGCSKIDDKTDALRRLEFANEIVIRFINAGMTLSDFYCDRFFRVANVSSRKRRFTRNLSNDVGGAIATAMGLARVASGVVGGVAGGFAFADSSFRNYDESFMVDADLSKMRRLVLSAQDNMKLEIRNSPPETIFGAESKVIRYAGLCSFLGMQDLLNESIAEKTVKIEDRNKTLKEGDSGKVPAEPKDDVGAPAKTQQVGGSKTGPVDPAVKSPAAPAAAATTNDPSLPTTQVAPQAPPG